jgi:hypothetical protein
MDAALFAAQAPGKGAESAEPAGRQMETSSSQDAALIFDPLRPSLMPVAYRMMGSVADAEDAVQDAFLRWLNAGRDIAAGTCRVPASRRIRSRLCGGRSHYREGLSGLPPAHKSRPRPIRADRPRYRVPKERGL